MIEQPILKNGKRVASARTATAIRASVLAQLKQLGEL